MPRLQGPPIDVPVPAGSPAAAGATPILVPAPPGWGAPAPAAPAPAPMRPAPPPAIVVPAIPPHPGPFRVQQRSLADMANEQLRRGAKPRVDPMAAGIEDAAVDDCLHAPTKPSAVGGLLAAPALAARALSGRCAK